MAKSAQELYQDALTAALKGANSPNIREVSDNTGLDGIVEVEARTATPLQAWLVHGAESLANHCWPFILTGTVGGIYFIDIGIPKAIQVGDTFKVFIDGQDHIIHIPAGTPTIDGGTEINSTTVKALFGVDGPDDVGDGFPWNTGDPTYNPKPVDPVLPPDPVVPPSTTPPANPFDSDMADYATGTRSLVIYEQNDVLGGRMMALDPANASGVPIPAFRPVKTVPPTGTIVGEAIVDTTSKASFIWDGLKWVPIVPPSIVSYSNDSDILNDAAATAGTYAFSAASGNLFVRYNNGAKDVWRQVGVRTYPTEAGLLADTPSDGAIGFAADTGVVFYRANGAWQNGSIFTDTQTNLLAVTPRPGQIGVTTDTSRFFVGDGTGNWVGQPWLEFATEVALKAATPKDGTLAVALDTSHVFYRNQNAWTGINTTAIPQTDLQMVGDIKQSWLTEAEFDTQLGAGAGSWVLADGRDCTGTKFAAVTGLTTVPDLRGGYMRPAGQNSNGKADWNGGTHRGYQDGLTKLPVTAFTGVAASSGSHRHLIDSILPYSFTDSWEKIRNKLATGFASAGGTADEHRDSAPVHTSGDHTHQVTITGGDAETRPNTWSVNTFIKVN